MIKFKLTFVFLQEYTDRGDGYISNDGSAHLESSIEVIDIIDEVIVITPDTDEDLLLLTDSEGINADVCPVGGTFGGCDALEDSVDSLGDLECPLSNAATVDTNSITCLNSVSSQDTVDTISSTNQKSFNSLPSSNPATFDSNSSTHRDFLDSLDGFDLTSADATLIACKVKKIGDTDDSLNGLDMTPTNSISGDHHVVIDLTSDDEAAVKVINSINSHDNKGGLKHPSISLDLTPEVTAPATFAGIQDEAMDFCDDPEISGQKDPLYMQTGGCGGGDGGSVNPILCKLCRKQYKNSKTFNQHKNSCKSRTEGTPLQYQCEKCNKSFTRKAGLVKHVVACRITSRERSRSPQETVSPPQEKVPPQQDVQLGENEPKDTQNRSPQDDTHQESQQKGGGMSENADGKNEKRANECVGGE